MAKIISTSCLACIALQCLQHKADTEFTAKAFSLGFSFSVNKMETST